MRSIIRAGDARSIRERRRLPARPCGPFGMTSKEKGGAVREDVPAGRCVPATMTPQGAKVRHILFAVIPAEAGIQRILRGVCLDPGSALRAVRDDVKRGAYRRGGRLLLMSSRGRRRRNPGSSDLAATVCYARCPRGRRRHLRDAHLDPGSALRAVRDDVRKKGRAVRDGVKQISAPCGLTSEFSRRSRRGWPVASTRPRHMASRSRCDLGGTGWRRPSRRRGGGAMSPGRRLAIVQGRLRPLARSKACADAFAAPGMTKRIRSGHYVQYIY